MEKSRVDVNDLQTLSEQELLDLLASLATRRKTRAIEEDMCYVQRAIDMLRYDATR